MQRRILCITVLAVMLVPGPGAGWTRRSRADRDEESREKAGIERQDDTIRQTYLDTLNRGRELYLTDEELSPAAARFLDGGRTDSVKKNETEAYRVQCFASNDIEAARGEKRAIETKISKPVYIVFDPPYYKIHAGDFLERPDAEKLMTELKKIGYRDAWIVRGKMNGE